MLTIYRRHLKACEHRAEGRKYRRCRCPIWVDGMLHGLEIRESLEMRDWERAQRAIREWEGEGVPKQEEPSPVTIELACSRFLADAESRELRESTLKKYGVMFGQLKAFATDQGFVFLKHFDLEALRLFRQSWQDSGISAVKKLERLRAFMNFAHESNWIEMNPAKKLKNPKVTQEPTLPFSQEEVIRILAACSKYPDNYGSLGGDTAIRLRALVLLLRYSGMRIGDAVTCTVDRLNRLKGDRLFLYTQKTGVPVNTRLPHVAVDALNTIVPVTPNYFFWSGIGKIDTASGNWRRSLRKLFFLAGIDGGHPHRFRDMYAVELLMASVPLERVSILLGHSSVRVTEKHYSPWIHARQEQLEADLERSWARDPIVLAAAKGTPGVHAKAGAVN